MQNIEKPVQEQSAILSTITMGCFVSSIDFFKKIQRERFEPSKTCVTNLKSSAFDLSCPPSHLL